MEPHYDYNYYGHDFSHHRQLQQYGHDFSHHVHSGAAAATPSYHDQSDHSSCDLYDDHTSASSPMASFAHQQQLHFGGATDHHEYDMNQFSALMETASISGSSTPQAASASWVEEPSMTHHRGGSTSAAAVEPPYGSGGSVGDAPDESPLIGVRRPEEILAAFPPSDLLRRQPSVSCFLVLCFSAASRNSSGDYFYSRF